MRPNIFLATIGRGSNGSNALEVTEDRAAVTAESQDNIINRVNNISQYGPSWHYVPGIGVAGTAYAEVPGSALGDLAFTRASSKTRTNAAGVIETIGNNVPPHDYRNADGTLSTFPRLNLEPQRTNSIRNSSMVGAVAGSPGTTPTNWAFNIVGGLSTSITGIGTENGLPYIDIRFNGTATGIFMRVIPDSSGFAATTGQVWSFSYYAKLVANSLPAASYQNSINQSGTGGFISSLSETVAFTSALRRYVYSPTLNGGATQNSIIPFVQANLTIGQTYDFTIRIAAPQMELGAYATTWVPTTTAAVTRLADSASKTGVSSLIGQTEGTLFVELNVSNLAKETYIFRIDNVSTTNVISLRTLTSNSIRTAIVAPTTSGTLNISSAVFSTGSVKIAFAYKSGEIALSVNGATALTANGTFTFGASLTRISLGNNDSPGSELGEGVTQAALFPTRLTNDQLAQLTTL